MVEKIFIDLNEYELLVHHLCAKINKNDYKYVYGIIRGGCLLASMVANQTGLKQVDSLEGLNPKNVLVVDDLIDSGHTRDKYITKYDFKVLINKQTDEKYKGKWIEFFYEKTDMDDKDLILRLAQRLGVELDE